MLKTVAVLPTTGSGNQVLADKPTFNSTIGVGGASASSSGAGMTFPATQSPSTDPNTLDDYEEQNYSPSVSALSGAFTTVSAIGTYTKVGRLVTVQGRIDIANNGTAAGVVFVSLPFAANATYPSIGCGRENNLTGNQLQVTVNPGSSNASISTYANGYPGGTGTSLFFTVTYAV